MRVQFDFCPRCAGKMLDRLLEHEDRERRVCASCGFVHYDNPTPAAGVIVVQSGRVLLVKRKFDPKAGLWTLPAGFVESGENVADCAIRETREETSLDVELTRVFDVYSAFDDPRASVVLILYLARQVGGELRCGDDASDADFFDVNRVPVDIAFRAHRHALEDLRTALANGTL